MPVNYNNTKITTVFNLFTISLILLLSCTFFSATAQDSMSGAVVTDFLNVYNTTTDKAAQLADAIPVEKYDWRPAKGIRSVRESVLHLASGNYFFGSMLGVAVPEGIDPRSMEQSGMSKEEAISALKESVAYIQDALNGMQEDELDAKVDFFGNEITKRQAIYILGDHAAEHLGQLIAYARMNEVVPPWSQ